ncbi:MAG: type II secretion system protein GspI [Betaproteobacteria bacterium]|nr:type II secretion system protein GspI [Betaproteobacteria bacterium]NBX96764.1 type II secretion system protein GspI [Betaproteobacteria bacterium]
MREPTAPSGGSPRRARGFTLVEVLVALAIVAVTLAAGVKASGALVLNSKRQQQLSAAQWCADNHLTELKLTRAFPGTGQGEFTCEQLGVLYRGHTRTQNTPNPNFRRVDVQIFNEDGYGLLTVSTVLSRF